jgi:hypothetical protein
MAANGFKFPFLYLPLYTLRPDPARWSTWQGTKKRTKDTALVKMMKMKKKRIILWITTGIINRPGHSAIMMSRCSYSLIWKGHGISWLWRSTLNIPKDTRGSLNGKLGTLLPSRTCNTKQIHSKIFVFSKVNNFIFNPVLLIIVLALDDDAFKSNIKSARDIFRTRVRAPRHSLQLR